MSNRLVRVSELLKREIGQCLERDFEFRDMLVTVHAVDVTPDLRNAHVFIGIVGSDEGRGRVIDQLNRKRGSIQTRVMRRVVLKYTPQLHFRFDGSVERGVRVVNLLDEIAQDLPPEDDEGDDDEMTDVGWAAPGDRG